MIHFDEGACVLYLDGQFDAQRAAEFSAHAAVCGECASLLGALKEESRLLSHALVEQDEPLPMRLREAPWSVPALTPASPSASWALWAWALSFGLAAAAALALWTSVLQPWAE